MTIPGTDKTGMPTSASAWPRIHDGMPRLSVCDEQAGGHRGGCNRLLIKVFFLVSGLLLGACFRGQPLEYPFEDVSAALKEKLIRDESEFGYVPPELYEESGYMYLYQSRNINFYLVLQTTIRLKKETESSSQIMIKMVEFNRSWNYTLQQKKMEEEMLEAVRNRMGSGKWGPLPWETKYKKE